MTYGEYIKEYNSTHDDSILALVQGDKGVFVARRLSREAKKAWGEDAGYTAYREGSAGDGFWIWKIIK